MGFEVQNIFDVIKARNTNALIRPLEGSKVGFPHSSVGKESACTAGDSGSVPGLERSPWRRKRLPTPVFLPGKSPWTEELGGLQSMG